MLPCFPVDVLDVAQALEGQALEGQLGVEVEVEVDLEVEAEAEVDLEM